MSAAYCVRGKAIQTGRVAACPTERLSHRIKIEKIGDVFKNEPCFWTKNGDWVVKMLGLGKMGKEKTFENVRKSHRNV